MIWMLLACESGPLRSVELEASCADPVTGGSEEALWRVDCYRAVLELPSAQGEERLHSAAQAHADYMEIHGELTHEELGDNQGFTGEYVWNRAAAAGFELSNQWISEVLADGLGPAGAVDLWMGSVYHRAPLVDPDLSHLGFGEAGVYTSMVLVGDFPGTEGAEVIYPPDGMVGVPVDFDSDSEWPDPAPEHQLVGFPITWSVARRAEGGELLDVKVELTGPEGELEVLLLQPEDDPWLEAMAAVVPVEPLRPASSYEVSLSGVVHDQEVEHLVRFETE